MDASDVNLIQRSLAGDGAAFAELLERHGPTAAALIRREVRDHAEAQDVLQQTIRDAWLSLPRLREPARFRPWLLQIARRRCRDAHAASRRRPRPMEASHLEARLDRAGRVVTRRPELIERALDELAQAPPAARQAAELFYLQGLSVIEIARRLGAPEGTIKRRLHDARAHLRSRLMPATSPFKPTPGEPAMETTKARSRNKPLMPETRPAVEVTPLDEPPFEIDTPELLWSHIVPQIGQRALMGTYEPPEWRLASCTELVAVGPGRVHRQDCVAIEVSDWRADRGWSETENTFYARTTEDVTEYLAVALNNGRRELYTFLDEGFDYFWGGQPRRHRDEGRCREVEAGRLEIVGELSSEAIAAGAWSVRVGERTFPCLRLLLIDTPLEDTASLVVEAFLTREGRTVLQRHYAHAGALAERLGTDWGRRREALPLTINGVRLVHWYDQLTGMAVGL